MSLLVSTKRWPLPGLYARPEMSRPALTVSRIVPVRSKRLMAPSFQEPAKKVSDTGSNARPRSEVPKAGQIVLPVEVFVAGSSSWMQLSPPTFTCQSRLAHGS